LEGGKYGEVGGNRLISKNKKVGGRGRGRTKKIFSGKLSGKTEHGESIIRRNGDSH